MTKTVPIENCSDSDEKNKAVQPFRDSFCVKKAAPSGQLDLGFNSTSEQPEPSRRVQLSNSGTTLAANKLELVAKLVGNWLEVVAELVGTV